MGANESVLLEALRADLNKSPEEGDATEIGFLLKEIGDEARPLAVDGAGAGPDAVRPLAGEESDSAGTLRRGARALPVELPASARARAARRGAGRRQLRRGKPSELAPATARAIEKLVGEAFDRKLVATMTGGPEVAQALLA
jgi:aldehyde dehydrogenase (NAD+)